MKILCAPVERVPKFASAFVCHKKCIERKRVDCKNKKVLGCIQYWHAAADELRCEEKQHVKHQVLIRRILTYAFATKISIPVHTRERAPCRCSVKYIRARSS